MKPIRYHSLNGESQSVTFLEAAHAGLAPDGGLYMPDSIPRLPEAFFLNLPSLSLPEIAYCVADTILQQEVPSGVLKQIMEETFNFDIPLRCITPQCFALEMWHGESGSYKDIPARFMARLFSHIAPQKADAAELVVLNVAVGGTGMALARGFHNTPGVRVLLLYPKGSMSRAERVDISGVGDNIHPVEVNGTFDDCQTLVRQALADQDLRHAHRMTVVNSLNLAAILGELFGPFWAYASLVKKCPDTHQMSLSIPCGNLGTLTAAVIAARMGLPIQRLIAATNDNDTFVRYLEEGIYEPRETVHTIAAHIDIASPANLPRLQSLFPDIASMRQKITATKASDAVILETIRSMRYQYDYRVDPHGALAFAALQQNILPRERGVFLATLTPHASVTEGRIPPVRIPVIPPSVGGLKRYLNKLQRQSINK